MLRQICLGSGAHRLGMKSKGKNGHVHLNHRWPDSRGGWVCLRLVLCNHCTFLHQFRGRTRQIVALTGNRITFQPADGTREGSWKFLGYIQFCRPIAMFELVCCLGRLPHRLGYGYMKDERWWALGILDEPGRLGGECLKFPDGLQRQPWDEKPVLHSGVGCGRGRYRRV